MGYFSGLVALIGIASIFLSMLDNSIEVFILGHLGLTFGLVLLIIGFIGFLGTFKKDGE
ncbi:MAG: hypothetical protein ACKVOY_08805 [Burkholderiaceae bacterium]